MEAKAIKKLTKKLGREPTEKEVAKKVKKMQEKEGDDEAESPVKEAKKSKKDKKDKKRKTEEEPAEEAAAAASPEPEAKKAKTEPSAGSAANPDGLSKCFLGNLSYDIDDDQCKEFFKDCGTMNDIYWLTDKETGKFFGSGFITFDTPEGAAAAVGKVGEDLLGRPLKIEFAKPKPGGDKPRAAKKTYESKPMSEKPDGCLTVFCGNLSYDIDDDSAKAFFKDCGEINKIRWLTDRESGDFKGCGFIEFYETAGVDAAALLNGKDCLGRAIRIDYAAAKKKDF
jgi:nucleolin